MTISCAPITTDKDQFALDSLVNYCMTRGLNMMTMRSGSDKISITIEDNGSGEYRVLESYVAMIHAAEQEKANR